MWSVHQVVDQMKYMKLLQQLDSLTLCWVCDTLHGRATARSVSRSVCLNYSHELLLYSTSTKLQLAWKNFWINKSSRTKWVATGMHRLQPATSSDISVNWNWKWIEDLSVQNQSITDKNNTAFSVVNSIARACVCNKNHKQWPVCATKWVNSTS